MVAPRLPEDISVEVRKMLEDSGLTPRVEIWKVAFKDVPVIISPQLKDEYDILQDIKDQHANVTFGQLLHDNINYQKLILDAWRKRRQQRIKLPSTTVNFLQTEDFGAPELEVEIEG